MEGCSIVLGNDESNEGSPPIKGIGEAAHPSNIVLEEIACPVPFPTHCVNQLLPKLLIQLVLLGVVEFQASQHKVVHVDPDGPSPVRVLGGEVGTVAAGDRRDAE